MKKAIQYTTLQLVMSAEDALRFQHYYNLRVLTVASPKLFFNKALRIGPVMLKGFGANLFKLPAIRPKGIVTSYTGPERGYIWREWHKLMDSRFKGRDKYIIIKLVIPMEAKKVLLEMIGTKSIVYTGPTRIKNRRHFPDITSGTITWSNRHNVKPTMVNIFHLTAKVLKITI